MKFAVGYFNGQMLDRIRDWHFQVVLNANEVLFDPSHVEIGGIEIKLVYLTQFLCFGVFEHFKINSI